MYELTCPNCGQKVSLPFVRVGAAAQCRSCGTRYHVQSPQVARKVTTPAVEAEGVNPLVLGPPLVRVTPIRGAASGVHHRAPSTAGMAAPAPATTAASATTTATATSPPGPPTPPPPTRTPPPPTRTPPPATNELDPQLPPALPPPSISAVAQMIARRKRQRRRAAALRYLGVFVGVLLVMMVIGWLMRGEPPQPANTMVTGANPSSAAVSRDTLSNAGMETVVAARRIEPANWQSIDRAPQYDGQDTDPIRLEEQGVLNRGPQYVIFNARVICSSFDIIEDAVLQLELIDRERRAYAQTAVPLLLLSGSQATQVRVPIARASYDRLDRIGWRVQVDRKLVGGVMFDRVIAEPIGQGEGTALRMTAFNPLPSDLKRAVFVIQALDERDELLGRWRVEWNQTIGPRQRVELTAATPLIGAMSAGRWQVLAAGEPVVLAQPQPPSQPQPTAPQPAEAPES